MGANHTSRPIPYYASSMVGREPESELLEQLILDPGVHLVTVTGTAGVGKTRLTTTVARGMGPRLADGVFFVPLVAVSDPRLVPAEIGKALDLQGDDLIESIRDRFRALQGIVLLDNLEQVIECAPDIAKMLPVNPDLTVVVTSQRPLHIEGERVIRLYPLPVPNHNAELTQVRHSPSVQLIVERASGMDISFADLIEEPTSIAAVAEICRRLDGIPLALELAASRLASLSPEVVLAQLQRGRQILSSTRRDIPDRQRTMHAAIAWSFDLLPEETRKVFLWLGVFPSGFDLELVEHVTAHLGLNNSAIDTVSELINLSLARRVSGGTSPWYTMLESIREFCLTELRDSGDCDSAHAIASDYVMDMANQTEDMLTGEDIGDWKAKLDREFATVRYAVTWALEHESPLLPMMVAAGMWRFLEQEGRWQEAVDWVTRSEEWADRVEEEVYIAALIAKMTMQEEGRDLAGAVVTAAHVERMLDGKDYPEFQVQFLLRSGSLAQDQQLLDIAAEKFRCAAELAEQHGIARNLAVARGNLGIIDYLRGNLPEAEANFLKVKDTLVSLGDKTGLANILSNLAAAATLQSAPERALEYLEEATELIHQLGLRRDLIYTSLNQSSAHISLGHLDAAAEASEVAIQLAHDLNYPLLQATGYVNMGEIYLARGSVSSSAGMVLRALNLITPEEGSRHMVELGLLLADGLCITGHYDDARALLGKSEAFATEIEFVFDPQHLARIDRVRHALQVHVSNDTEIDTTAREWTTERFLHSLTTFSRRLAAMPANALVTATPASPAPGVETPDIYGLTPREREILQLLIDGNSTRNMADFMSVSPRTVTTHIGNIMAKFDVSSRAELVAKALRNRGIK